MESGNLGDDDAGEKEADDDVINKIDDEADMFSLHAFYLP